ncbi:MAG: 2-amino-4-hydroxy-6-hydroxymethyldihydropteridine diphosphokinase [Parvibaculales bacterium]
MIYIGVGANLPLNHKSPQYTLPAALKALGENGIEVKACSAIYRSVPVSEIDQADYYNSVAGINTPLHAPQLLQLLHHIEAEFGRDRNKEMRWGPRILDMDLLDYKGHISTKNPTLPHPRISERAFVLLPLQEVAPQWVHPQSGASIDSLIASLPKQSCLDCVRLQE